MKAVSQILGGPKSSFLFPLFLFFAAAALECAGEPAPSNSSLPPAPFSSISNPLGITLVQIPSGSFEQGTPEGAKFRFENETLHRVRLTQPYWMSTTHVTVGHFAAFVDATGYVTQAEKQGWSIENWRLETNAWKRRESGSWKAPGFTQESNHPVVCVTWEDAVAFCQWMSGEFTGTYRLPTEAEWEYACRAGASTLYPWGEDPEDGEGWANVSDRTTPEALQIFPPFPWSDGFPYTSPVGQFRPNAFGLHDMIGNTLQWCRDWYGAYPTGTVDDPTGPETGEQRILRGGSFLYGPQHSRSAFRGRNDPDFSNFYIGFRVVLEDVEAR